MPTEARKTAILAITRHGAEQARRLHAFLPGSELFVAAKFRTAGAGGGAAGVTYFDTPIRDLAARLFATHEALICFVALGAVVRTIAPCLTDKKSDPAVLVIDDDARFVISLLSGHQGGANALAEEVARALGATPVITTASDVRATLAVDLLGAEFGWVHEPEANVTRVSAAVVNDEAVGVWQETGEKTWWARPAPLPASVRVHPSLAALMRAAPDAALLITDRLVGPEEVGGLVERVVFYRPKSLVLGVGCDRGAAPADLEDLVRATLAAHRLSFRSVRNLATIDLKKDEESINAFAARHGLRVEYFTRDELNQVKDLPNPSETVRRMVGTPGVCEPAALLSARAELLLVEKVKGVETTLAVARVRF